MAILIQILAFYVTYFQSRGDDGTEGVHTLSFLSNTCQDPETSHFADWCHRGLLPGGFFLSEDYAGSDILVVFFVTLLLFLAAPFTFGLFMLWLI